MVFFFICSLTVFSLPFFLLQEINLNSFCMTNKLVSVLHLHISHHSPCLFNNKNFYLSPSPFQPSENSYQAHVSKCTEKYFFPMSQHSSTTTTCRNELKPPKTPAAFSCPVRRAGNLLEDSDQEKQKSGVWGYSWWKKEQFENKLNAWLLTSGCGGHQAILPGDSQR